MGLLDDAIREHLDLKRRSGADPAEIERAEREALGPVRREPSSLALADEPPPHFGGEASVESVEVVEPQRPPKRRGLLRRSRVETEVEPPDLDVPDFEDEHERLVRVQPLQRDAPAAVDVPPPLIADETFAEDETELGEASRSPSPRPEPPSDAAPTERGEPPRGDAPPPVAAPGAPGRAGDETLGETAEYDVEGEFTKEPADGDVLEETPEFLQDTPDHDRLWFEQRPPRDFDFDG